MTKKKTDELRCSGCDATPPDNDIAEAGWYTVIRAWKGGTRTYCYCSQCHEFVQYSAPAVFVGENPALKWH